MSNSQSIPVPQKVVPGLEKAGEDIKFEHGNVFIEGEVNGALQSHGFQVGVDGVYGAQLHSEHPPLHHSPAQDDNTAHTKL